MTGGTKLMFAGALSACWELDLDPFYFEIRHHNVIFLRDGTHVPFVGISDVEDFLEPVTSDGLRRAMESAREAPCLRHGSCGRSGTPSAVSRRQRSFWPSQSVE